jgi:hypothetical protein
MTIKILYHGSQKENFKMNNDSLLFFTDNKGDAESWALKWTTGGLSDREQAFVYTAKVSFNSPFEITNDEDWEDIIGDGGWRVLVRQGYDCFIRKISDDITYYIIPNSNQFRFKKKELVQEKVEPQYLYHGMFKCQWEKCKEEDRLYSHMAIEKLIKKDGQEQYRTVYGLSTSRSMRVSIQFMENILKEFTNEWKENPDAKFGVKLPDGSVSLSKDSDLSFVVLVLDYNKIKNNKRVIPHSYMSGRFRDSYGDEMEELVEHGLTNLHRYVVDVVEFNNNLNQKTLQSAPIKEDKKVEVYEDTLENVESDNDYSDLRNLNRVAGWYNLSKNTFTLLPRTTEDIDATDKRYMDYAHNTDMDYLIETGLVRFGIEQEPDGHRGSFRPLIVCYIEAPTLNGAVMTVKAIRKKFSQIHIDKFNIEYLDKDGDISFKYYDYNGKPSIYENKQMFNYVSIDNISKMVENINDQLWINEQNSAPFVLGLTKHLLECDYTPTITIHSDKDLNWGNLKGTKVSNAYYSLQVSNKILNEPSKKFAYKNEFSISNTDKYGYDLIKSFIKENNNSPISQASYYNLIKKEFLVESAESDMQQRQKAFDIFKAIKHKIYKNPLAYKDIHVQSSSVLLDVTKEVQKVVPEDTKKHYLCFVYAGKMSGFRYGKSDDADYIFIPHLELEPVDLNVKLLTPYANKFFALDIEEQLEFRNKAFLKYIKKNNKLTFEYNTESLIHEIIHYLDFLRGKNKVRKYTDTFSTEQDYIKYFNDPFEQNAFYQETAHLFNKWATEQYDKLASNLDTFQQFLKLFLEQYRGRYENLSEMNKKRLIKRIHSMYVYLKKKTVDGFKYKKAKR